jgi:poly-gamma-glutamate synthesis protein (capsule biosynthesis protein)
VTIAFAGDFLMHGTVNRAAASGNTYDYSPLLAGADPWIAGADLAICQLEVPLAPDGVKPSSYPIFATPPQLARDIAEQGWDGCTTATNHSVDQGWAGVEQTINKLTEAGLGYSGTALSEEDSKRPQLYRLTSGGISLTIAHIAFTYGLNGLPLPSGKPWAVNTPIDVDQVIAQATEARSAGADIVIASIHAGVEYRTTPTDEQRAIATALAQSGVVDAMIGGHAHVAEPIELVPGGVDGNGMWTVYSLGNYISGQSDDTVGPNTDTGLVVYLTATKGPNGTGVTNMTWAAVTVDSRHGYAIYMLEDSLGSGGTVGQLTAAQVKTRYDRIRNILGSAEEQLSPPTPSGAVLQVLPRT